MINQGEIPSPAEAALTPEQIAKSDIDLTTIDTLASFANERNGVLHLMGGYATEAHLTGSITRTHRDIDAVLWLENPEAEEQVAQDVLAVLNSEGSEWTPLPVEKDHFADFSGTSKIENLTVRSRLELYFHDKSRIRELQTKTIIDSKGKLHEVKVEPIESLVAGKIAIIQRNLDLGEEELKRRKLRETNDTDLSDLRRLIKHPSFSKERWQESMVGYLQYGDVGLSKEKASQKANAMWNNAMQIIGYSQHQSS